MCVYEAPAKVSTIFLNVRDQTLTSLILCFDTLLCSQIEYNVHDEGQA